MARDSSQPWPHDAPHPADEERAEEPVWVKSKPSAWHHRAPDEVCEIIARDPTVHLDLRRELLWIDDAPRSAPKIRYATTSTVVDLMGRSRIVTAEERGADGPRPCSPPHELVSTVLSRRTRAAPWRSFAGFASGPYMLATGEVIDRQGMYDPLRLWLPFRGTVDGGLDLMPDGYPTQEAARTAMDGILSLVSEFPWADPKLDPAVWLGYLLTLITRPAYETAPLFLFEASRPRSGKDLLLKCAERVAWGSEAFRITFVDNEDENEKRLATALLDGHTGVIIGDASQLGNPLILSILTEGTNVGVRKLGENITIPVPPTLVLGATANNVMINKPDLIPRIIALRLEPMTTTPESTPHTMDQAKLKQLFTTQRAQILSVCFDVMRGFIRGHYPAPRSPDCGTYPGWADLVRDCLTALGYPDIVETQARLAKVTPVGDDAAIRPMIAAWYAIRGDLWTTSKQLIDAGQLIDRRDEDGPSPNDPNRQRLADALALLMDGKLSAKAITKRLSSLRGSVHAIDLPNGTGIMIQVVVGNHHNQAQFALVKIAT